MTPTQITRLKDTANALRDAHAALTSLLRVADERSDLRGRTSLARELVRTLAEDFEWQHDLSTQTTAHVAVPNADPAGMNASSTSTTDST